ncbi:hypothetical protein OKW21_001452 [Catalinimonas alkaloidigena]|nr:hypothetical protein [Catalinimonas alkaloidigena]
MEEYISNGAAFGWLIDPYEQFDQPFKEDIL